MQKLQYMYQEAITYFLSIWPDHKQSRTTSADVLSECESSTSTSEEGQVHRQALRIQQLIAQYESQVLSEAPRARQRLVERLRWEHPANVWLAWVYQHPEDITDDEDEEGVCACERNQAAFDERCAEFCDPDLLEIFHEKVWGSWMYDWNHELREAIPEDVGPKNEAPGEDPPACEVIIPPDTIHWEEGIDADDARSELAISNTFGDDWPQLEKARPRSEGSAWSKPHNKFLRRLSARIHRVLHKVAFRPPRKDSAYYSDTA